MVHLMLGVALAVLSEPRSAWPRSARASTLCGHGAFVRCDMMQRAVWWILMRYGVVWCLYVCENMCLLATSLGSCVSGDYGEDSMDSVDALCFVVWRECQQYRDTHLLHFLNVSNIMSLCYVCLLSFFTAWSQSEQNAGATGHRRKKESDTHRRHGPVSAHLQCSGDWRLVSQPTLWSCLWYSHVFFLPSVRINERNVCG